jgi:hypothetical protein
MRLRGHVACRGRYETQENFIRKPEVTSFLEQRKGRSKYNNKMSIVEDLV